MASLRQYRPAMRTPESQLHAVNALTAANGVASLKPVFLLGPTACGKTALALALAEHIPLEIISVDSALIYRGMDIGTAKPSPEQQQETPHHLIDTLSPTESYGAARFVTDALQLIPKIRACKRLPLLVGGTMLYAKALREGLNALPPADAQVRAQVQAQAQQYGWQHLHARLMQVDPITATRLAPLDAQRIGRALEVYLQTGKPLSAYHLEQKTGCDIPIISLEPDRRAWLHERIEQRFDAMLEAGLVQEVQHLYQQAGIHAALPAMRCVGYRQVIDSMEGRQPWQTLAMRGKAASRQLAKRQLTWLRGMQRHVVRCDASFDAVLEQTQRRILLLQ